MKYIGIIRKPFFLALLCLIIITLLITIQSVSQGSKNFGTETEYTHYNNFKIFQSSYFHLIDNKDLYSDHPNEHWDFYKYSPTFPVLIAPLAFLPDFIGLLIWNLLNVIPLFIGVWLFPRLTQPKRLFFLLLIVVELITSIQNSQSNGLIAGLILLAFISLERKKAKLAALFILLTAFIKVFGIVACLLFLFYPNKLKSGFYLALWGVILVALPLIFVTIEQLQFLYKSWFELMSEDHSASLGLSVAGWISTWFQLEPTKNIILLTGAILLCLPLAKIKYFSDIVFKQLLLASILIWIVIFNHKAESPTFIIAVTGIGIWFFAKKRKGLDVVLLSLAVLLTILSSTDLFPRPLKDTIINPYVLKVVPCILIWFKVLFELLTVHKHQVSEPEYILNEPS